MSSSTTDRYGQLDPEAFAKVVARTWREYGFVVDEPEPGELPPGTGDVAAPVDGGVALLVRAATPRLLVAAPGAAGEISAATLLAVYAEAADPADLIVVSAVGFDTAALSVADAYGIDVVGPESLAPLTAPTATSDD